MGSHRKMLLFLFLLLPALAASLPRFEVHWESEKSYEDVDPMVSPWHIKLGDINVGPPGYLGGPSVVTIDSADYCAVYEWCQEYYPDVLCNKYPPEGVPNKPGVVEDWGTKYNITSNLCQRASSPSMRGEVKCSCPMVVDTRHHTSGMVQVNGSGLASLLRVVEEAIMLGRPGIMQNIWLRGFTRTLSNGTSMVWTSIT